MFTHLIYVSEVQVLINWIIHILYMARKFNFVSFSSTFLHPMLLIKCI